MKSTYNGSNPHDDEGRVARVSALRWLVSAGILVITPSLLAAKGCEVGSIGSNTRACGGITGLECKVDEFCNFSEEAMCGAADATGKCEAIPDACDDVYDPVCGCDDVTYSNECEAHSAGVSVVKFEACDAEPGGTVCGGLQGLGCAAGEYCNTAELACAADATGVCESKPEVCTQEYSPVCGCDGVTYGNACSAAAAGVTVAKTGECDQQGEPKTCGTRGADDCASGEFCQFEPDALCGANDKGGVCTPAPDACTKEYKPVCGCDGETYSNGCMANMAGTAVQSEGECGEDPTVCEDVYEPVCGEDGVTYSNACEASGAKVAVAYDGECEDDPTVCPAIYAPVCGENGKTYGNACEAAAADVVVSYEGECDGAGGATCGGLAGLACAAGEFCNFAPDALCGAADQTGTCTSIPEACDAIYAPVCGCDDKTYSSDCDAHLHGISVASEGECKGGGSGSVCGGLLGAACSEGQFCNYPVETLCGAGDQTGTCELVPEDCTEQYEPVCGCDGKTYGNACSANSAGISVAAEGECGTSGTACGGLLGAGCGEGEFCNYPIEAMCGAADQTGSCQAIPEACTADYTPVCGCDDKTYGNACAAYVAGVSVASEGECEAEPSDQSCGGPLDNVCPEGTFCQIPAEAECSPEVIGVCTDKPEICTEEYSPVCGCDGETYSNACFARGAGTSIASNGECD